MSNNADKLDTTEDLWKDVLKFGTAIAGTVWATKKINTTIVNHHRKDNVLKEFENQDLSWRDSQRLKTDFKQHDFYVTKFPDTHQEIFPLAVKILYQLIKYHNNSNPDSRLGEKILKECQILHRIAIKKHISPINQEWPYWKLVQQEVPSKKKNYLGRNKMKRQYFTDSSWNLEDFLNIFEGSLIRTGLFGINTQKRIHVCFYEKKWLGKLEKGVELEETESDKTLKSVWDTIRDRNKVVKIYDPQARDYNRSELAIYMGDRSKRIPRIQINFSGLVSQIQMDGNNLNELEIHFYPYNVRPVPNQDLGNLPKDAKSGFIYKDRTTHPIKIYTHDIDDPSSKNKIKKANKGDRVNFIAYIKKYNSSKYAINENSISNLEVK